MTPEDEAAFREWAEVNRDDLFADDPGVPLKPMRFAIGWQCEHMNITSLPGALGRVSGWCGCVMERVYSGTARPA